MTHELASTTKAWTTLRGRETVALGRELLGGNGIVSDFLVSAGLLSLLSVAWTVCRANNDRRHLSMFSVLTTTEPLEQWLVPCSEAVQSRAPSAHPCSCRAWLTHEVCLPAAFPMPGSGCELEEHSLTSSFQQSVHAQGERGPEHVAACRWQRRLGTWRPSSRTRAPMRSMPWSPAEASPARLPSSPRPRGSPNMSKPELPHAASTSVARTPSWGYCPDLSLRKTVQSASTC